MLQFTIHDLPFTMNHQFAMTNAAALKTGNWKLNIEAAEGSAA